MKFASKYDHESFIEIWNSAECVESVMTKTRQTRAAAQCMASKLRSLGYTLKRFPFHRPVSLRERLLARIKVTESGCWEWTGSKNKKGYGQIQKGKRGLGPILTHVASYIVHYGEVPKGMVVMHTCDNPPCINPEHLVLGSYQQNTDDMLAKGRATWQKETAFPLSDEQRAEIKKCFADGETNRQIANRLKLPILVVTGTNNSILIAKSKLLTAFGETKSVIEWLKDIRCVVAHGTLLARIKKGRMTPEEMLSKPSIRASVESVRELQNQSIVRGFEEALA